LADTVTSTRIAAFSALVSLAAFGFSWNTASKETYRDKIDARISNCATVASFYASQSWEYKVGPQEPDPLLASYTSAAVKIGRAAQLCRNEKDDVADLKECIKVYVDTPESHKVDDKGSDGKIYSNLVC
jgi:hypothetical protein